MRGVIFWGVVFGSFLGVSSIEKCVLVSFGGTVFGEFLGVISTCGVIFGVTFWVISRGD